MWGGERERERERSWARKQDMDAESDAPVAGAVDYRGRPAIRASSGGWTAALFLMAVEIAEGFSFYGISSNLITYFTDVLRQPTASAAAAVNTWYGTSRMLPLLGAFVADSFLGRYRTIVASSLLYILGIGMLSLSSLMPTNNCPETINLSSCNRTGLKIVIFYIALYIVAVAQGGHKPCVQAFGADQFDQNDPKEFESRAAFFNWWFFGMCGGIFVTIIILSYIQDNIGWVLGFGIPCIVMGMGLVVFLLGTRTYRYYFLENENPFARIVRVFFALATRQGGLCCGSSEGQPSKPGGEAVMTPLLHDQSEPSGSSHSSYLVNEADENVHTIGEVEEAKRLLRLFPIWASCLIFAVVASQTTTFFIKQGSTLDRRIGKRFQVPSAALLCLSSITIVAFVPIYDRILVPITKKFSRTPTGITMLQRIGIGITLSFIAIFVAALVEMKRLKTARDFGLVNLPTETIPMSLWWLIPQYILCGIADVFTTVGLQEFFYDQVPDTLRSLGLALYYSIFSIGNFISSLLISVIDDITTSRGKSWFSDNLNQAHLDYFYWLLAGLNFIELVVYIYFAQSYVYKKKANILY